MLSKFLSLISATGPAPLPPASAPAPEPPLPHRDAAMVREDLAIARGDMESLREKLTLAQGELDEAQRRFDGGMLAHALGDRPTEPQRGELQAAIARTDALRRVLLAREQAVTDLCKESGETEQRELSAQATKRLASIERAALANLETFERALAAAKAAEAGLFDLLYDPTTGLKQRFATDELNQEARRARFTLANRILDLSERLGHPVSRRFTIDGEVYLGDEMDNLRAIAWARGRR